jgi:hypothetical protein
MANGGRRRIAASEMVGVPLTTREVQRLLDALAEGKPGPIDDPEVVSLQRKLNVMRQVADHDHASGRAICQQVRGRGTLQCHVRATRCGWSRGRHNRRLLVRERGPGTRWGALQRARPRCASSGILAGESLDDLLPEAFAAAREVLSIKPRGEVRG